MLAGGQSSRLPGPWNASFTGTGAWTAFWQTLHGECGAPHVCEPPPVDFSEFHVIAVALGEGAACRDFTLEADAANAQGNVTVRVVPFQLTPLGCSGVVENPWRAALVPAREGAVAFVTEPERVNWPAASYPPSKRGEFRVRTLALGVDSALASALSLAVKDGAAFRGLWANHTAGLADPPPAPVVSPNEQVIAVFMGTRPSGGFAIRVVNADVGGNADVMHVERQRPLNGTPMVDGETRPFHLVAVADSVGRPATFVEERPERGGAADGTAPAGEAVDARPIVRGGGSAIAHPARFVVRDDASWRALWAVHSGNVWPAPDAPPRVDFSEERVVAVFMGQHRSGGYDINVTRAEATDGFVRVHVHARGPAPGTFTTAALSQPFHFVAIPAGDVPVKFVESSAHLDER